MKLFKNEHAVSVSPSIVIFSVFFVLGLYALFLVRDVIAMLFVAVIIMSALNPAVTKLEKRLRIPRLGGIAFMYVVLMLLLSLVLILVVPPLLDQLQNVSKIYGLLPINGQLQDIKFELRELNDLVASIGTSLNGLFAIIMSTFNGIFTFFTVSVMSFYLLIDRKNLHKKIGWFTKNKRHYELMEEFVDSLEVQLGGWVRGQFILMVLIGIVTYAGLVALGIPYALPLAVLAALLEVLPNLGPTIAAIPATIMALLTGGVVLWAMTVLFYIVVQQLENSIIVPKIMKDNADVNPLVTIVTILIGLQLGGVIGALISVPVYIVIRSIYSLGIREHFSLGL